MTTDYKREITTASIADVRAVATAYAKVAASRVSHERVQRMLSMLAQSDVGAVRSLCGAFNEQYAENFKRDFKDLDIDAACNAAFAIEQAARALDERDPYEARFGALGARNRAVIVILLDMRVQVNVNGPHGDTARKYADEAAAEYVSAEKIAEVLA